MDAVPTHYAGTDFRSRLEAKWAAFADLAEWPWVYEPFNGKGYLPDFCFTVADRPLLVEVKPVATVNDARAHLPKILNGIGALWKHDIIVCGIDPARVLYIDFLNGPTDYHASPAIITQGRQCDHLNLHPDNWQMPCHCTQQGKPNGPVADSYVHHLWREAGNRTKWRAVGGAA